MSLVLERRRHPRLPIERPCKVFHKPSRQYLAASTCDISEGGALVRVDAKRPLNAGDEIDILIAWTKAPVVTQTTAIAGKVLRTPGAFAHHQFVAVRFEREQEVALAA